MRGLSRRIIKNVLLSVFLVLCFPVMLWAAETDDPPYCPDIAGHPWALVYCNNGPGDRWLGCRDLLSWAGDCVEYEIISTVNSPADYTAELCRRVDSLYQVIDDREGNFSYIAILGRCMDFGTFFNQAILWGSVVGAGIALARFGIGALQYAWSTGDPTKLEAARETILYAVVGMLIIALSYLIVRLGSSFVPESWRLWFGV